jgi:ERCC4-type nuclease
MIIAPTEPQRLRDLGTVNMTPEKFGCDILIMGAKYRIGVQRKKFPADFLTSIADGRLGQQAQMMETIEHAMVILEGYGVWSSDGELMEGSEYQGLKISTLYALIYTIQFEFGVPVLWLRDMNATIDALVTLEDWAQKTKHNSLRTRPGVPMDPWGKRSNRSFQRWILQGFPGVGPDVADRIIDHFGAVPMQWTVGRDELMEVPGVGAGIADKLLKGLEEA